MYLPNPRELHPRRFVDTQSTVYPIISVVESEIESTTSQQDLSQSADNGSDNDDKGFDDLLFLDVPARIEKEKFKDDEDEFIKKPKSRTRRICTMILWIILALILVTSISILTIYILFKTASYSLTYTYTLSSTYLEDQTLQFDIRDGTVDIVFFNGALHPELDSSRVTFKATASATTELMINRYQIQPQTEMGSALLQGMRIQEASDYDGGAWWGTYSAAITVYIPTGLRPKGIAVNARLVKVSVSTENTYEQLSGFDVSLSFSAGRLLGLELTQSGKLSVTAAISAMTFTVPSATLQLGLLTSTRGVVGTGGLSARAGGGWIILTSGSEISDVHVGIGRSKLNVGTLRGDFEVAAGFGHATLDGLSPVEVRYDSDFPSRKVGSTVDDGDADVTTSVGVGFAIIEFVS